MIKKLLTFIGILCFTATQAQTLFDSTEYTRKTRPKYIVLGLSLGNVIVRDYATSPIIYRGVNNDINFGILRVDALREIRYSINTATRILNSSYNNTNNSVIGGAIQMEYVSLYRVPQLTTGKWNTKAGGTIVNDLNIRMNPGLQNNALGVENITNLMVAGKTTFDFSRTEEKSFKFLFLKKTFKPIKRELSFSQEVGVLNFNLRPGYSYTYLPEINGTESLFISLSDYQMAMNGWRLRTEMDYTSYYPNGNALQIGYIWNAYSLPGKFDEPFQLAGHCIKVALLFRTR